MAWYYGTYSCGHEGKTNIVGPVKNREWISEQRFSGLCPECYEKDLQEKREKENAEAAEKAKEMELPELKGTEKQVAWANTLRQNLINRVENKLEGIERRRGNKDLAVRILHFILKNKTKAVWYIDNKDSFNDYALESLFKTIQKEMPTEEEKQEKKIEAELKAEATVYPENKVTEATVEIIAKKDKVIAIFEKNDKFKGIVRELGYTWQSNWVKIINELTGSYKDRAAELGNKLLNAGFPIAILDMEIREKAIAGDYEPECDRWIMAVKNIDELVIKWWEKNDMLYHRARSLPGSKWRDGRVLVKIEHYKEIQEFALLYDFKLTKVAQRYIEQYIETKKLSTVVAPAKVEVAEKKDGLKEILKSGSGILDDLKD